MPTIDMPSQPTAGGATSPPAATACVVALCLVGFVLAPVATSRARAAASHHFGLAVHAVPGIDPGFVRERIALANRLFADASVEFDLASEQPLDPRHRVLGTREDRDALGAYRTRGAIDVFVVDGLVDVDEPPLPRRGVHWRDRTHRGVRYVIVIGSSNPWVLPHELGHYFGNGHSDVVGNLMCYERGNVTPFFDALQLGRIRRSAAHLARTFRGRR